MKKLLFLILVSLSLSNYCFAKHELGGYIQYQYMGHPSGDTTKSIYSITVNLFYSCKVTGPRQITMNIYNGAVTNLLYQNNFTSENTETNVTKTTFSPCIDNPPPVSDQGICYLVDTYTETVTLPNTTDGYVIGVTTQGHRTNGIVNICCNNSQNTSLALYAQIPGIINGVDYHTNSSPTFLFKDTAVICYGNHFDYQFTAIDNIDHDSLSYSFGSGNDGATVNTPPYAPVVYTAGFSGTSPLGSGATINPATGLISGIAPTTTGQYIIDVYVKEWRKGILIDSIKKELQIDVLDCTVLSATLQQVYVNCDSLTLSFQNLSTSSNITSYLWTFGDSLSNNDSSTSPTVSHTYTQPGDYTLSLYVSNGVCNNSTTADVKVYPGFVPKFGVKGSCYQAPFYFTDSTKTNSIDSVNSWSWNFGDPSLINNTAFTDTASHLYSKPDTVQAILQVTSYRGCSGSDTMQVIVNDKPYIFLPFHDTLICSIDTLPLIAQTSATSYKWSPTTNMIDSNSLNPIVHNLNDTVIYSLTAYQNGCVGTVYDTVNVLHYISVGFNPDTMHVCFTDSITLSPISYALSYHWTESDGLNTLSNDSVKYPKASPTNQITTYHVYANLGHCPSDSVITVYASAIPKVSITGAVPDTICYGDSSQLTATKSGAYVVWLPANNLSNDSILNPKASPSATTNYTITVTDTPYCPTPVYANITLNVVPQFSLNAGDDTSIVLGEPLPLNAYITDTSFGYPVTYNWLPTTYLNYSDSANPTLTAYVEPPSDSIKYRVTATTAQGCTGAGYVWVKFYTTQPDIFVPTAFTPNGAVAKNDVLTPVPVGISHYEYFRVYNRFGQLVFSTSQVGVGWDGTYNGSPAAVGTYVWMTQGVDYLGKVISHKGTVVLIR
jgi:gliding motility-associated-like protein